MLLPLLDGIFGDTTQAVAFERECATRRTAYPLLLAFPRKLPSGTHTPSFSTSQKSQPFTGEQEWPAHASALEELTSTMYQLLNYLPTETRTLSDPSNAEACHV